MKECRGCGEVKEFSEYYRHSQMSDGHLNFCKVCKRADAIAVRNSRVDYYRQYDRGRSGNPDRVERRASYAKSEAGIASHSVAAKRFRRKNPVARQCHTAVNNAVRDGVLIKQPCEVCGSVVLIHGHHDDYSKPLVVRWLCPKHHSEWHKNNVPLRVDVAAVTV